MLLEVYVDDKPVNVEVEARDDLSAVACLLEKLGCAVNPAFPCIYANGQHVLDWTVDMKTDYHFCKQVATIPNAVVLTVALLSISVP